MRRRWCRRRLCPRSGQRSGPAAGYCCIRCRDEAGHSNACDLLREQSSVDVEAHPGNLVISTAPRRVGKYLYIQKGSALVAVARFLNEEAAEVFCQWARRCDELGLNIDWTDDGEEGHRQEQA